MAGKTSDPKPHRITLRLSDADLRALQRASKGGSIGSIIRRLIRAHLKSRR